jgi:hypothetical protein
MGFTPAAVAPPNATGTTSSSLSAGAVWGDRYCPLIRCTKYVVVHIKSKRNTPELKSLYYLLY